MLNNQLIKCLFIVFLFQVYQSDLENRNKVLWSCTDRFTEPGVFADFGKLIDYFGEQYALDGAGLYHSYFESMFKHWLIELSKNRKKKTGGMYLSILTQTLDDENTKELNHEATAKLIFQLVAAGNLLGIYRSEADGGDGALKAYQLQNTCRSMNIALTAYDIAIRFLSEENEAELPTLYLIMFAGLVSSIGFENVLSVGEREQRNQVYFENIKNNWAHYRLRFAKSSTIVPTLDEIIGSDLGTYVENNYPKYREIVPLLGKLIYERVFHEPIPETDVHLFDSNMESMFNFVTTGSFLAVFTNFVESSNADDSIVIFHEFAQKWNPCTTRIVSIANAFGAIFSDNRKFVYMIPTIYQLILLEEYAIYGSAGYDESKSLITKMSLANLSDNEDLKTRYMDYVNSFFNTDYFIRRESLDFLQDQALSGAFDSFDGDKMLAMVEWFKQFDNSKFWDEFKKHTELKDMKLEFGPNMGEFAEELKKMPDDGPFYSEVQKDAPFNEDLGPKINSYVGGRLVRRVILV